MKRLFAIPLIAVLSGCASGPYIDRTYSAKSQGNRVQFLILHYTVGDFQSALSELTGPRASSHYLVRDDPPVIYQLVDENRQAHHAGVSSWNGHTQVNATSIGIEIVNLGYQDTSNGRIWFDYPPAQIDAVLALARKIVKEHAIKPAHVLGHSDIAPQRKHDPGPRFPWKRFADEGLILWPDAQLAAQKRILYEQELPDIDWFQQKLAKVGYSVPLNAQFDEATVNVIAAFQKRYRPSLFDGIPDAETAAMLEVLTTPRENATESGVHSTGFPNAQ